MIVYDFAKYLPTIKFKIIIFVLPQDFVNNICTSVRVTYIYFYSIYFQDSIIINVSINCTQAS